MDCLQVQIVQIEVGTRATEASKQLAVFARFEASGRAARDGRLLPKWKCWEFDVKNVGSLAWLLEMVMERDVFYTIKPWGIYDLSISN